MPAIVVSIALILFWEPSWTFPYPETVIRKVSCYAAPISTRIYGLGFLPTLVQITVAIKWETAESGLEINDLVSASASTYRFSG